MSKLIVAFIVSLPWSLHVTAQELKEIAVCKAHTFQIMQATIHPSGKILAMGGGDTRGGELSLYDLATGKEIGPLPGYSNSLYALAFSPDGSLVASGDIEHRVMVWEVSSRKQLTVFKGHSDWVHAIAFSRDGKRVASAGRKEVKVWNPGSGKELVSFNRVVEAWSMAFSHDLKTLASPNYQEIDLWDVSNGKERLILSEHRGHVRRVAFSADDKILASASAVNIERSHYLGELKLWECVTGKEMQSLKGPFAEVTDLAISEDAKTVAIVQRQDLGNESVKVLDVASSRVLVEQKWPERHFISLQFESAGRLYVKELSDTTVKVWEYNRGR